MQGGYIPASTWYVTARVGNVLVTCWNVVGTLSLEGDSGGGEDDVEEGNGGGGEDVDG